MHDLPLIKTIAAAFTAAWLLGMLTHRLGLSPIVGYLLAGVVIGPFTPGFSGDVHLASQLAEVGVILLMFGVGMHFHLEDLLAVRSIALPGAIGQSVIATVASIVLFRAFGWPVSAGLVTGVAMAVASTVVLMRVLMDTGQLDSPAGHAAVGWLIVEDILTVVVLVLIPALAGSGVAGSWIASMGLALGKFALLIALVMLAGSRFVPKILVLVARLRSRELFTLTILVLSIAVATGSAIFFGASVALGAFMAGMLVGQSPVSEQAGADALPLRDAFAVLFFVSVGMLFDPHFPLQHPFLLVGGLVIVCLVKPLAALSIVALLGYPVRTGLTVAIGLAQIGEFSFIVSELARKHDLVPDVAHNLIVACAIVSITINPLLFRSLTWMEEGLRGFPRIWSFLSARSERRVGELNAEAARRAAAHAGPFAVIVGFGPTGRRLDALLREQKMETVVVDLNMDAILEVSSQGRTAIYGDAAQPAILEAAGTVRATHLILTMSDSSRLVDLIAAARELNPSLRVLARTRYLREQPVLAELGHAVAVVDELEAAVGLTRLVLTETGAAAPLIEAEEQRTRQQLAKDTRAFESHSGT